MRIRVPTYGVVHQYQDTWDAWATSDYSLSSALGVMVHLAYGSGEDHDELIGVHVSDLMRALVETIGTPSTGRLPYHDPDYQSALHDLWITLLDYHHLVTSAALAAPDPTLMLTGVRFGGVAAGDTILYMELSPIRLLKGETP